MSSRGKVVVAPGKKKKKPKRSREASWRAVETTTPSLAFGARLEYWPAAVAIAAAAAAAAECRSAVGGPCWSRASIGSCTWSCGWTSSWAPSGTRAGRAAGAGRRPRPRLLRLRPLSGGTAAAAAAVAASWPSGGALRRPFRPGCTRPTTRRTVATAAVCSRSRRLHRLRTLRRPCPRRNRPRPRNRCCSGPWSRSPSPCPAALPWSPSPVRGKNKTNARCRR